MGRSEPCHGVLGEGAHRVYNKGRRVQLHPILVQDARERISQIHRQQNLPEEALPSPWVHPDFGCAYVAQSQCCWGLLRKSPSVNTTRCGYATSTTSNKAPPLCGSRSTPVKDGRRAGELLQLL